MKDYEFISYESFPDDVYIREIVQVMIAGVIHPYSKIVTKDGGMFWSFPGVNVLKNGVKKRFNAEADSKSLKIKFDQSVENYIKTQTGQTNIAPTASIQYPHGMGQSPNAQASKPTSMSEAAEQEQLPF